jgi:hypothetical protein
MSVTEAAGAQVVIAKLQHITVKEFLPLLGISEADLSAWTPKLNKPDMAAESIAYRFGAQLAVFWGSRWCSHEAVQM